MSIAHELITRGWHQGDYEAADGSVCIAGAARYAVSADAVEYERWRVAVDVIRALVGMGVGKWNDYPHRTFDEVLRVAKEADEILGAS